MQDTAFSPDRASVMYSTWSQYVHLIHLESGETTALDFRSVYQ